MLLELGSLGFLIPSLPPQLSVMVVGLGVDDDDQHLWSNYCVLARTSIWFPNTVGIILLL